MSAPFQLFAPDFQADPFPHYVRMREEGLSRLEPGGFYVLSRYADVSAALRNTAVFSSAGFPKALEPPWLGPNPCSGSMHSLDPPEHTKLRNLVNTAFLAPVVERTAPLVQSLVDSVAERFAQRGEAEILTEVALPVTAGTIGHFMGFDPVLHARFKGWTDAILSITPEPRSPEHAKHVRESIDEEAGYLRSLIEERRAVPGQDMVSLLVHAEVDGQHLSDKQLVSFLALLLIAGMETTAHLITKSMLMLADRPHLVDLLRADPSVVPRFVEEMLRYDPPAHSVIRLAKTGAEVAGQTVPAGASVLLMIAAANRDEHQFPSPDVFDMERDSRGALAFGLGPHFCIGAGLARMQARLVLTELLRRFRRFEHAEPAVVWKHSYIVRGPKSLRLRGLPT